MFKLYLGCAIPFGERKPYVDLSDPSHLVAAVGFIGDSCSARPSASYLVILTFVVYDH